MSIGCKLRLPAALVLTSALASCGNSAVGPGLSMKLSRDEVTLHEPVVVEFAFRNPTDHRIDLDLGVAEVGALDFEILPAEAGSVERIAPTLGPTEWHTGGKVGVEPGEIYRSRILLNRWFAIRSPGTYEVVGEFIGTVTQEDLTPVEVERHFVLPLRVLPRDPQQLLATAGELVQAACQTRDLDAAYEAAKTLSTIDDTAVVPSLEKLLDCGYTAQVAAVAALGRIDAPEAVTVLLEAAQGNDPALSELARTGLRSQVQRRGSEIPSDLRRRIEGVLVGGDSGQENAAGAEP